MYIMSRKKIKKSTVREPVQVYMDRHDRDLLEELARKTGASRAELLRQGLRHLAEHLLEERAPGSSLSEVVASLGENPELPTDLTARLDQYLFGSSAEKPRTN